MKIGIVGDLHFCQYSSILRGRGDKFSKRLENCIKSVNWAEDLFEKNGCRYAFYLGDFFDRAELNAEELSALKEIKWTNKVEHTFIVGNHELGNNDLSFNSADALKFNVYNEPMKWSTSELEICFLPYILESNRKPLVEYFEPVPAGKRRIILSHNDIAGIQMGQFISKQGFTIEEIESCCDKFINGHLHNGEQITKKIINIGNLTGQNFSEDASRYEHCVFILDTDTLAIDVYENPHAFNFYKLDASKKVDFSKLKNNAVITLKCLDTVSDKYKEKIKKSKNILDSRVVIEFDRNSGSVDSIANIQELSVDHLSEFKNFILDTLGNNQIVLEELAEVCK